MGGASSIVSRGGGNRCNDVPVVSWKKLINIADARKQYVAEGSICGDCSEEQLECRVLLNESIGFSYLEAFVAHDDAKSKVLKHWKMLINKRNTLNNQFSKIVDTVYSVSDALLDTRVSVSKRKLSDLSIELMACFDQIFIQLFVNFKRSDSYLIMCYELNMKNSARPEDFDYFTKLGAGAFGCVFSCRKRSTGMMYAMKVQPKAVLLWSAPNTPENVMIELLASTGCPSPFLVQAQYAFQTAKLVFLALPLYSYGDLRRALKLTSHGCFSRARAQFYAAELASVLMFLHSNGLMHRDLKPENVFIDSTGHLVLGDLGSVSDEKKRLQPMGKSLEWERPFDCLTSDYNESQCVCVLPGLTTLTSREDSGKFDSFFRSSLFVQTNSLMSGSDKFSPYVSLDRDSNSSPGNSAGCSYSFEMRPDGVVGTLRYMAPEVLALFADKKDTSKIRGCTPALDWFSYGVMVHEMLTGSYPFNPSRKMTYDWLAQMYPSYLALANYDIDAVYTTVMGPFDCSDQNATLLGPDGMAFVIGLIELDPLKRLGLNKFSFPVTGTDVYSEFKANPFFEDINWKAVGKRAMTPPVTDNVLPSIHINTSRALTFSAILQRYGKSHWLDGYGCGTIMTAGSGMTSSERSRHRKQVTAGQKLELKDQDQMHFKNWFFNHPSIVNAKQELC